MSSGAGVHPPRGVGSLPPRGARWPRSPRSPRRARWRWSALLLCAALTVLAGCQPGNAAGGSATPKPGAGGRNLPSSMASLGDSMTTAYGSCLALVACPRNSWSTGDTPAVQSHYRRILAGNPAIKGNARNYAVNGAVAADLAAQATKAALAKPAYVTILIGANDACRRRITDMTDPDTFSAQVGAALAVLKTKVPKARILIASIPDVYQVWQLGHSHRAAIAVWRLGVCQSLLADPTSTDNVDVARRLTFRDRISTYDELLSSACRRYGAHCRYDGGAVHRTQFTLAQLSVLDFFHPNASGENRLASVSFPANFDW